ncbi:MAG: hypothetical protein JSU63_11340 [Phycisphaerales bacterium]|nr:MAG: hypothetical protein JSU63_11340 [Phycisphaerales bacterium]
MTKPIRMTAAVVAAVGAMVATGSANTALAETHTVIVGGASPVFMPSDIVISVGDTVHWDWDGGVHDVESGVGGVHDGKFDSGSPTSDTSTTFDVTFDQAFLDANPMVNNEYPYYCSLHFGSGMTGTVTVQTDVPAVSGLGVAGMLLVGLVVGSVMFARRGRAGGCGSV